MKKIICFLLTAISLSAAPKAVVFDWGDVLGSPDRQMVVDFLCKELAIPQQEFDKINQEKKRAKNEGKVHSDEEFWVQYALKKNLSLTQDWQERYLAVIKDSMRKNHALYELINELKKKNITVGLLSNIDGPYVALIREFGFYEPFEPCLLSNEIGLRKPDPKAYQLLLDKLGFPPEEVVFIDDKVENIEAARNLGIDGILFISNEQIQKELESRNL